MSGRRWPASRSRRSAAALAWLLADGGLVRETQVIAWPQVTTDPSNAAAVARTRTWRWMAIRSPAASRATCLALAAVVAKALA
ncbi:hypothetical protein FZ025_02830 [Xanthomonas hyacinthi]|uniref:hypothetical protein n=1 Tax=Xanthomonas hyacinthi TaxID=56455 RepID=UPI00069F8553|nr:hypothetical protein [Xanthomonas hyacinthi]QGY75645.1 hypothetical protein FZ025_02830 [Xanthomonas hyacinthi]